MSDKLPDGINDVLKSAEKLGDLLAITKVLTQVALYQKIKFDTLKKAGFSDDQALELCKGPLIPTLTGESE